MMMRKSHSCIHSHSCWHATTQNIQLDLATKAIEAKQAIAKESSIVLLPDGNTEAASLVTQAMAIINKMNNKD